MNEYDSNRIFDITKKINYVPTTKKSDADCYIINTCHIREKATDKVFHDVGRVKKEYKNKKKPILIITGCVAQAEGDLILKKDRYIDAVIGPQSYQSINKVITDLENKKDQVGKLDAKNMISTNAKRAQNHPKLFSLSSTAAFSTFPMGTFGFFAFFLFASQYKSPPASHYEVSA